MTLRTTPIGTISSVTHQNISLIQMKPCPWDIQCFRAKLEIHTDVKIKQIMYEVAFLKSQP